MSIQTFRYLACGGGNTVLDIVLFYVSFHYLFGEQPVHVLGITIAPYVAALIVSFCITFPLGFALAKYVVFQESKLKGRIQLFRYAVLVSTCIILNYLFIKLFVEWCHIFPTVARILTTIIVALYSYVSQRRFTFKVKPETVVVELPVD